MRDVLRVQPVDCRFVSGAEGRLLLNKRAMRALALGTDWPSNFRGTASSEVRACDCDTFIGLIELNGLLMVHSLRISKLHILLLEAEAGRGSVAEDLFRVSIPYLLL